MPQFRIRVAILVAVFCSLSAPACAGTLNVAVASNFAVPMRQIAGLFRQESGVQVNISTGSTGKFYAQIREGAPFDVFVAADAETPLKLEQAGWGVAGTRFDYAVGKLALWSLQPGEVDEQGNVLRQGAYRRLAIADPRLAPYGMAAKQVLERMGLWDTVQGKLVVGENITQTWQFAATGNVGLAFVALSQIMRDGKVTGGSYWIVPARLYRPIRQSAVMLSGAKDKAAARALLAFMRSAKAADVILSYGYALP